MKLKKFFCLLLTLLVSLNILSNFFVSAVETDTEGPIITEVSCDKVERTLLEGESIKYSFRLDDTSGIGSNIGMLMVYKNPNGSGYKEFIGPSCKYNSNTGLYECIFTVSSNTQVGVYEFAKLHAYDKKGNYSYIRPDKNFYVGIGDINDFIISEIPDQLYTGSAITPQIEVYYAESLIENGIYYSLSYNNNVEIGVATVTICKTKYSVGENRIINFNITGFDSISSISISKLPNKLQYIENEEKLDLTGGILTLNYESGSKQDIDLTALSADGFDNRVLGKQTITIKYGDHSAEFEVEVIARPISFVAISTFPNKREYILGNKLDLTGGKIAVGYPEGNYETFDLTADMISDCNMNQSGYQIVTVTYKEHTTEFVITIFKNGDINGDDNINATDVTMLRINLLNNYENKTRYDINQDGVIDVRDLVNLKKKLAGIVV